MKYNFSMLLIKARIALAKLKNQDGQDLIEYALIVALIAFAATAGMKNLSTALNVAFGNIANLINSYIS